MRAGSPLDLALRAIHSTAASLTSHDIIYLRIDGGLTEDQTIFEQAAAPVPLRLLGAEQHQGLAACLNELIEEVLLDERWQLIARMDADDESLPGRMEIQRAFLAEHPDVDILGTACIEVNEHGQHLQTKRMPLNHGSIFRNLPHSNPLNHPSVVIRRRVFDSGLRYRTNVSRTEDYHLWIDAASKGFVLANLPQPLLKFRRDSRFFDRRGGLKQAIADLNVRLRAMRALRQINLINFFWAFAAFALRLMPGSAQRFAYLLLR
jgi:glycosyltransferase involved in cell wall biosynthesis